MALDLGAWVNISTSSEDELQAKRLASAAQSLLEHSVAQLAQRTAQIDGKLGETLKAVNKQNL